MFASLGFNNNIKITTVSKSKTDILKSKLLVGLKENLLLT